MTRTKLMEEYGDIIGSLAANINDAIIEGDLAKVIFLVCEEINLSASASDVRNDAYLVYEKLSQRYL